MKNPLPYGPEDNAKRTRGKSPVASLLQSALACGNHTAPKKGVTLSNPGQKIKDAYFTVLDVETTGLGEADRVIEIACLRLRAGREIGRFHSLVNPGMTIAPAASEVSGITDEMVAHAPIFPEIYPEVEKLLAGAVLVAHNAPFDLRFLSRERKRWDLPAWKGPVLDTLRLARNTLQLESYSLGALEGSLQLEHAPSHRALSDVLATVALLTTLTARIEPPPITVDDLLKAQEPIRLTWEEALATGLEAAFVATLRDAQVKAQLIELDYESRSGVHTHWIRPLHIEHNGPLYYLAAHLAEQDELRTFRFNRIQNVRISGATPNSQPRA